MYKRGRGILLMPHIRDTCPYRMALVYYLSIVVSIMLAHTLVGWICIELLPCSLLLLSMLKLLCAIVVCHNKIAAICCCCHWKVEKKKTFCFHKLTFLHFHCKCRFHISMITEGIVFLFYRNQLKGVQTFTLNLILLAKK